MNIRPTRAPPRKFFTAPFLLAAVFASLLAAGVFSVFGKNSSALFSLEVRLVSSVPGCAQLYYDRGAGLSETDSSRAPLPLGPSPQPLRLPVPPGRYSALRFDPIDREGTVIIASPLRLVARDGRVLRTVPLAELRPNAPVCSLRTIAPDRVELVVAPGANDPQLALDFSPPLELRAAWRDLAREFFLRALGVLLFLAALLFTLERLPLLPGETPPRRLLRFAAHPPLWLTLAACAAILVARRPEQFFHPQFWGEDSVIFFQAAYLRGAAALLEPYASYLHAVPRLAAAASLAFDPLHAPTLFVVIALAGTLCVAARTQSPRCPLPRHAGCALAVVLVPDAYEVLLNVNNLQWFLAAGSVLLLISADPFRWWQKLHDAVAAVVLGLTGPFSILLFGLFVWRAWTRRTRASLALAALMTACAATQAWTVWRNPPGTSEAALAPADLLAVPGMRIAASLLVGARVPPDYPRAVELALGALTFAGVAVLALRRGPFRPERLWLALAFAALLAGSLYRCRGVLPDVCHATFGSRYFYPLFLIVIWLLFAAAASHRFHLARAATALVLWSLLVNLPRLRENAFADLRWSDYAEKIRAGEAVDVPVNPSPWVMRLPAKK